MRIITEEQIKSLKIDSKTFVQWVDEALRLKKSAILPSKISMKPQEDIFVNVMPTIIGDVGGVKVVSRYPERKPTLESKMLLFNAKTGDYEALIEASYITTIRTAAVAVHSVKLLAKKNFSQVGFIGMGEIGLTTLKILLDVYCDDNLTVRIYNYKNRAIEVIKQFSEYKNVNFISCDAVEDVVSSSEVILSAPTYLKDDICADKMFKEGVLLVPIHTRGFTNCDLFFDKIYGDDYGHICHFKYFDKFRYFAETSQVILGERVGRELDSERIIAYNIGIALHDVWFASKITSMLEEKR